jgi:hypothetical protein
MEYYLGGQTLCGLVSGKGGNTRVRVENPAKEITASCYLVYEERSKWPAVLFIIISRELIVLILETLSNLPASGFLLLQAA